MRNVSAILSVIIVEKACNCVSPCRMVYQQIQLQKWTSIL